MSGVARVVVADTQGLFRAALGALLAERDGLDVVAVCDDADALVDVVVAECADVVVIAAELAAASPGLLPRLQEVPEHRVCVLVVDREPDEDRLVDFVEAGADGYLTRLDHVDQLHDAVDSVLGGHAYIPTEMLGGLLRSLIHQRRERDAVIRRFESLTKREVEVLAYLSDGIGGDDIAERLYISAATVRTHVQNVLRKLDVHSQVEAAALARRHGLFDQGLGWSP